MQVVKIVNLIPHEQVRTLLSGQSNRIQGARDRPPHIKARDRPVEPF